MVKHIQASIISKNKTLFSEFVSRLPFAHVVDELSSSDVVTFIDGQMDKKEISKAIERATQLGLIRILVMEEKELKDHIPELLAEGYVDDVLLLPIRQVELLAKIRHATELGTYEISDVNSRLRSLIEKMEEDLKRTRDIQHELIPEKFNPVKGLKVAHKYLSGLKSGGDYIDFFEFDDKRHLGILMSDSTGYGLSSAFLSVLLKLALKLSREHVEKPSVTVLRIFQELELSIKQKEQLSIFYGVLDRKTYELKYVHCGSIRCFQQGSSEKLHEYTASNGPLTKGEVPALKDHELQLAAGDRLVLCSDGFSNVFESQKLLSVLEKIRKEPALELVNQLTYKIKQKLETPDDMPEEDCSLFVMDIDKSALRLTRSA